MSLDGNKKIILAHYRYCDKIQNTHFKHFTHGNQEWKAENPFKFWKKDFKA